MKRLIPGKAPSATAARGAVDGFSAESRRRLMETLLKVDWARQDVYFVTLTYPGEYEGDKTAWKRDLHAFHQRMTRRPEADFAWAVWRLEPQRRGAPHFHVVAGFSVEPGLADLRDWTRDSWSRILKLKAEPGAFARVGVEKARLDPINGQAKLLNYLAKYVGKKEGKRNFVDQRSGEILASGRVWGRWGRLPVTETLALALETDEYFTFLRRIRKLYRADRFLMSANVGWVSWLAYIPAPTMRQLLRGLGGASE